MNTFPLAWTKLAGILSPSDEHRRAAEELILLYEKDRCWKRTLPVLLDLGLETVALFYSHLECKGEPLSGKTQASPMMDSFTFMNVRALGRGDRPGTFLDAAKILPSLRAECLHLGPFTVYDHHVIYAVSSVRSISSRVTDLELERQGFTREWQLAALVQACHLLGKRAGFDIEPHVTQFAIPVLEHPGSFRWIRLNKRKSGLAYSAKKILSEQVQKEIVDEVRVIVSERMTSSGEPTLEYSTEDERMRREKLHHEIIGELVGRGLWTIPSQIWAGDGIPSFNFMHKDGYPVFRCLDRKGKDRHDEALNIVTPFRCDADEDLLHGIFPYWRDRFCFDFLRFDSVDHIFDSCGDFDTPRSDRPSPAELKRTLEEAKGAGRAVGALAERMGTEFAEYASCGFDALLGNDMFRRIGSELVESSLSLSAEIGTFNAGSPDRVSVCFAVDTHDTGDPNLLGAPLVESLSSAELLQRQFLSRFASWGKGFRPKYEVTGCSDRSYGLYRSNVTEENMVFRGDEDHCARYHFLEDIYAEVSDVLRSGSLVDSSTSKNGARWTISDGRRTIRFALAFAGGRGMKLYSWNCDWSARIFRRERTSDCPSRIGAGECCVIFSGDADL